MTPGCKPRPKSRSTSHKSKFCNSPSPRTIKPSNPCNSKWLTGTKPMQPSSPVSSKPSNKLRHLPSKLLYYSRRRSFPNQSPAYLTHECWWFLLGHSYAACPSSKSGIAAGRRRWTGIQTYVCWGIRSDAQSGRRLPLTSTTPLLRRSPFGPRRDVKSVVWV
jgi:hypothetical protein